MTYVVVVQRTAYTMDIYGPYRSNQRALRVDVSGAIYFVSDGQITVRIIPTGNDEGQYSIRYVTGQDMNYRPVTGGAASKALKLPRR